MVYDDIFRLKISLILIKFAKKEFPLTLLPLQLNRGDKTEKPDFLYLANILTRILVFAPIAFLSCLVSCTAMSCLVFAAR